MTCVGTLHHDSSQVIVDLALDDSDFPGRGGQDFTLWYYYLTLL